MLEFVQDLSPKVSINVVDVLVNERRLVVCFKGKLARAVGINSSDDFNARLSKSIA
jgi:hypothetical protein